MWEEALLGLAFFVVSGAIIVSFLRIFILKSSREAPVFRLNPQRAPSRISHDSANYERAEWLTLVTEQLRSVYLDSLCDSQLRGFAESLIGWDKLNVNEFTLGDAMIEFNTISVKEMAGVLIISAKLRFAGCGTRIRSVAEVPVPLGFVARCVLPLEVAVSEPQVEVNVRLTWELRQASSNVTFSFVELPVMSGDVSVQLGRNPKAIETPYVTAMLSQNFDKLTSSLLYPNALAWAVPHAKGVWSSKPRREDSVASCSPGINPMSVPSLDTPRTLRKRRATLPPDMMQ